MTGSASDLAATPLDHLSGAHLAAFGGAPASDTLQTDIGAGGAALGEFLAADTVVIGVAFDNSTVASQPRAGVDRVPVAGQTFHHTASGPEGIVGGKRVILAIARGNVYGAGSPVAAAEHAGTYLKTVFGFVGITAIEPVIAEGVKISPERRTAALDGALAAVAALAD